VITGADGQPIRTMADWDRVVTGHGPGETVALDAFDDGTTRHLQLTVGTYPQRALDALASGGLGIEVSEQRGGLVIKSVRRGSSAARIGIQAGDRLLAVAGRSVSTLSELRQALYPVRHASSVLLTIGRGQYAYAVTVPFDRT
jgi:serine protease Do